MARSCINVITANQRCGALENITKNESNPVSTPMVTIGVCVRNCENMIREAIESIIDQNFPHECMKVIFVDDGSEDRTLSIIKGYVSRMNIQSELIHQKWKGLGSTRNTVVKNADGKYIVWVDGDMVISKDFVEKQVATMEANPMLGIGKGKYSTDVQANFVSTLENMEFMTANLQGESADSKPLGTGGSIYRVEAIKQVGGFDSLITGSGEDLDAEHRVKHAGWSLAVTSAIFCERRRKSWSSLWNEYFWHGRGGSFLFGKSKTIIAPYKVWPPVAFFIEISRMTIAYKLTNRKVAFLLPLHFVFKRTAWFLGFLKTLFDHNGNE